MKVAESLDLGEGHVVEIGTQEDSGSELALRHRQSSGNGHGAQLAVEVPLRDVAPLVRAAAERDLLDAATAGHLIESLKASIRRSTGMPRRIPLSRLVEGITDDNLHAELDAGPSQGNEAW